MAEYKGCPEYVIYKTAEKLKVCGHPLRLKMLCMIERQDACVSDLWQCLNQSQPVISQHLAVLKEKGIVESEVSGNKRIYSVVDPFIKEVIANMGLEADKLGLETETLKVDNQQ